MRSLLLFPLGVAVACGGGRNSENSPVCGITAVAQARVVFDQFQARTTVLDSAPPGLEGAVPARVVGHGTGQALAARAQEGGMVLGFEGGGFPARPGFAVTLVDDSSEVVRGVLVFESDGPADYPQIGTISSSTSTLPLYAMRITWSRVSDQRCPLFAARDSAP
jgi:hypothetical protein